MQKASSVSDCRCHWNLSCEGFQRASKVANHRAFGQKCTQGLFYETDRVNWDGEPQPKQFPPGSTTDKLKSVDALAAVSWGASKSGATALNFAIPDPYNYRPIYGSSGVATEAVFQANALTGDGVRSNFRRTGAIDANTGDVTGASVATNWNKRQPHLVTPIPPQFTPPKIVPRRANRHKVTPSQSDRSPRG